MIKSIVTQEEFLKTPSEKATPEDLATAQDLIDTLKANEERCVGLAANMIGVLKHIIIIDHEGSPLVLFNAEIISQKDGYEAEEACLSLSGTRKTKRYKKIKIRYENMAFQTRLQTFQGFSAQIIQHELDHCQGILI